MAKRKKKRKAPAAAKRKRAKKRSTHHNPPAKRRAKRRTAKRRTSHNPGRRRAKRRTHHRRARRANPHHKKHRRGKRRSRRNPGIPMWAMAGLAGALGLGTFALTTSAAFGLTKRFDPALASLERNRYIAGGVATVIGLAVAAFASPILGAGVTAGGLAALAGTQLSFAIDPVFQLGNSPAAPAQTTKGLGAVFNGSRQQLGMGAVYGPGGQDLGAVFNGQAQILSGLDDGDDRYFGG